MEKKYSKNTRVLDIYIRLCEGKCIHKPEEAERFGVDERSIQRDIDDIRGFLDERSIERSTEQRKIEYDRLQKGFVMTGQEGSLMTNSEILAVSKILLESRALTRKEMYSILDKLIAGCVPCENMQLVSELIANEKYHYVELRHKSYIENTLWEIGDAIKKHELLEITYERQGSPKEAVKRVIQPAAIMFSEYYFYLNAYIVEKDNGGYRHAREDKREHPTIFRIDRLKSCRKIGENFRVNYASRFEEGEFRKRIQFMYAGELMKIQFRYSGLNVEAILDRLPTAKILSSDEVGDLIEAEVYGKGIQMWLLSQGSAVEVLKPERLRDEMRDVLGEMLGRYDA